MKGNLLNLTYEVELQPGEKLTLPEPLIASVGTGHWLVIIRPFDQAGSSPLVRGHNAFLNSYALEDEGLYDDDYPRPTRSD